MGEQTEYPLLDSLPCARLGIDVQTPHAERPRNDARHISTLEQWGALLPFPDSLLNAEKLATGCALELRPERLHSPEPKLKLFQTSQDALQERAYAALPLRYLPDARPAAQTPSSKNSPQ